MHDSLIISLAVHTHWMQRVQGQRQPDLSDRGNPLVCLTSLEEHMSPQAVPLLYQMYMQYIGNVGEFELPVNLCEQQHVEPGQFTSNLMVMEQEHIERCVPRFDRTLPNLKGVTRTTLSKQRKLCMRNNGQHGGNADRKVKSEEVGTVYMRMCGCDAPLRALEAYKAKDPMNNEIDDIFDAINLMLATGVEAYANEAGPKGRNLFANPLETGACLDNGKTFIRWHSTDPGEVRHARVIGDTGRIYPPRKGQMTLYRNDSGKKDDPKDDVLMPLPAFRILLMELINLRTNKTLFKWECADPANEPFYAPDQRSITDFMVLIREVEAERKERIAQNKREGARKAAETRKRKKLEAAGLAGAPSQVIEIKDEEDMDADDDDVVERARKRARVEIVDEPQ